MSAAELTFQVESVRRAMRDAEAAVSEAGMFPSSGDVPDDFPEVGRRLRRRRRGEADPLSSASLILNEEGALLWHAGAPPTARTGRRMRRGVPEAPQGELIELYQFQPLMPNKLTEHLVGLDVMLNGHIIAANNAAPLLVPLKFVPAKKQAEGTISPPKVERGAVGALKGRKKRLLFVHGTFSKTESFIEGFLHLPGGDKFLEKLFGRYDEVLAFDHATLSVSPVLNAFDLARMLSNISGELDVIAHSRGGLVTRWALEGFGIAEQVTARGLLVGCPINGTSLASPPRLRSSLSLLSNIGTALKLSGGLATSFTPLLIAPAALLRVAASAFSFASNLPFFDAAVQLVPGLAGQSRVGNNSDIGRIRSISLKDPLSYFVVQSDFQTEAAGWRFWKWFSKGKIADAAADHIFDAANDLVVDTASMTEFAADTILPAANIHDFGKNASVHHCNYFEQKQTQDFILRVLK
jgi:hypothetical protein